MTPDEVKEEIRKNDERILNSFSEIINEHLINLYNSPGTEIRLSLDSLENDVFNEISTSLTQLTQSEERIANFINQLVIFDTR